MIILPSSRIIGPGQPPVIVAEIGSNWTSLEDCLHSIKQAKLCGADAVKFQLFDSESLYGCEAQLPEKVFPGELPKEWLPKLKQECDLVGIEFMCSAFSPELIDAVDPYVNIHKVASAELTHKRMLQRLNEIGKPVFLSTGACMLDEIKRAIGLLERCPLVVMYCVAAYPAQDIDLGVIQAMREKLNVPMGFSDHSTDVYNIPYAAHKFCHVVAIEKHFTAIDTNTPDSGHSLNADQFKRMVEKIRGAHKETIGPQSSEKPMILRHKRRLIATRDIQPGDKLIENENFGIYRSLKDDTKAMHGFSIDEVNGKVAKKDIKAGDGISPSDI